MATLGDAGDEQRAGSYAHQEGLRQKCLPEFMT